MVAYVSFWTKFLSLFLSQRLWSMMDGPARPSKTWTFVRGLNKLWKRWKTRVWHTQSMGQAVKVPPPHSPHCFITGDQPQRLKRCPATNALKYKHYNECCDTPRAYDSAITLTYAWHASQTWLDAPVNISPACKWSFCIYDNLLQQGWLKQCMALVRSGMPNPDQCPGTASVSKLIPRAFCNPPAPKAVLVGLKSTPPPLSTWPWTVATGKSMKLAWSWWNSAFGHLLWQGSKRAKKTSLHT